MGCVKQNWVTLLSWVTWVRYGGITVTSLYLPGAYHFPLEHRSKLTSLTYDASVYDALATPWYIQEKNVFQILVFSRLALFGT